MKRSLCALIGACAVAGSAGAAAAADGVAFQPRVRYSLGVAPTSLAVADVNRDGKLDLVVGADTDTGMRLLYGRGDGSFRAGPNYAVPGVTSLGIADLNLDGKPDVVAFSQGGVVWAQGNGGGTFRPAVAITSRLRNAQAVADVNRDGKPDVVTTNIVGGVDLYFGDGRGGFTEGPNLPTGAATFGVAVADLNRDGRPDLAAAVADQDENNIFQDAIRVLLADPDGTYTVRTSLPYGQGELNLGAFLLTDLNFDDRLDLVVLNPALGTLSARLGRGDGTFQLPAQAATGTTPWAVVVADMNRDAKPDLVVADYGSNGISVLLGGGNGSFQPRYAVTTGAGPVGVAVGDFNADGFPDIAVAESADGTVSVLLGRAP